MMSLGQISSTSPPCPLSLCLLFSFVTGWLFHFQGLHPFFRNKGLKTEKAKGSELLPTEWTHFH